jgi:hypothetical protein
MTGQGKIRISLGMGELEVEGSSDFVAGYEENIRGMLARLESQSVKPASAASGGGAARAASAAASELGEFGEVFHLLPKTASGSDQILVAGYFVASKSSDQTFSTNEANKLLIEQGIKLSNPSQSLRNALTAKRVFKVGSRFRVSNTGEQYVLNLIRH